MDNKGLGRDKIRQIKPNEWVPVGRIDFSFEEGRLRVADGYMTSKERQMTHYTFSFTARAPHGTKEVQIWAGVRHFSRDFRYVLALRGGNNNHLYLARYGAEGHDRFLDLCPLEFAPEPGTWYDIKVVVAGKNIAVYLNNESLPRLLAEDPDAPFDRGGVSLGGGYLDAEFKNIQLQKGLATGLDGVHRYEAAKLVEDKEALRRCQVKQADSKTVVQLNKHRYEVSLNGQWLFLPDNNQSQKGWDKIGSDQEWHVMDVPNFWGPSLAWLEGERFQEGRFNKGQNDDYHRIEDARCNGYTFDYKGTKAAWYRQTLELPLGIDQKKIVIHFEGVSFICHVYVNGKKVHTNKGMFGPFDVDLTDHVQVGTNVLALYVDRLDKAQSIGSGDLAKDKIDANYAAAWDVIEDGKAGKNLEVLEDMDLPRGFLQGNPGGIWKPVTLIISNNVRIDDCYFVPSLTGAEVDVSYCNHTASSQVTELSYEVAEKKTGILLCKGVAGTYTSQSHSNKKVQFEISNVTPKLWEPGKPNLYTLRLILKNKEKTLDIFEETVGFRTIKTQGNKIVFNNRPLWIRGANHMPGHILPNNEKLAMKFMELALDTNVIATRTHCAPWSKTWMDAADEAGVLVSYEGTWPWLMLRGKDAPPEEASEIWLDDMERLFRANRNHPSIFLWTMNNEMKFMIYSAGKTLKRKGRLLNTAMALVRSIDSSRPVVADSAHFRKVGYIIPRLQLILGMIDDGDIDDPHIYNSWYESSFYHLANGEFSKMYAMKNRPLIAQEASTGYPRAQDGLPTRSYTFEHQTPQAWVGADAYEHADPKVFQTRHAMLTKGTFETLRRVEHDKISGVMPFAFETWFYHHHDYKKVKAMKTAEGLKMAFQPVLASLDLQILHYYAGHTIQSELTLMNDDVTRPCLVNPTVLCEVVYKNHVIASTSVLFESLEYDAIALKQMKLRLPTALDELKIDAKLRLTVKTQGESISVNDYLIQVAETSWSKPKISDKQSYVVLKTDKKVTKLLKELSIKTTVIKTLRDLKPSHHTLVLGDGKGLNLKGKHGKLIKDFAQDGGQVILMGLGDKACHLLPEYVKAYQKDRHEIITMTIKESPVFDGIEPLELSWFPYKPFEKRNARLLDAYVPPYSGLLKTIHKAIYKEKVPYVADGRFQVDRMHPDMTVLAETLKPHGYLSSPEDYRLFGGTPLFDVKIVKGCIRVSSIRYDATGLDPIADRLTINILNMKNKTTNEMNGLEDKK